MPFRFLRETTLGENIHRVLEEELHKAYQHLTLTDPPHKGIHEARKGHKKIRAVLRLIRFSINHEEYLHANIYYRDTARVLSNIRDATALIEAIDDLKSYAPVQFEEPIYQSIRQKFVERRDLLSQKALPEDELRETAANRLRAYQRQTLALPLSGNQFELIKAGLMKIYRQGWDGLQKVKKHPDMENIHDWRKRIKYLWYQLTLLAPVWPKILNSLTNELKQLSDWLGTWRDIGLVLETLELEPGLLTDQAEIFRLTRISEQVRIKLLTASLQLGENIYADPPKYFTSKTEKYWNNWKFNSDWLHDSKSRSISNLVNNKDFTSYLAALNDPRLSDRTTYQLKDILLMMTVCLLMGKYTPYSMHSFMKSHSSIFHTYFPSYKRFPSVTTLKRLIHNANFFKIKESFLAWCESYNKHLAALLRMPYEPLVLAGFPTHYVSYATVLDHCAGDIRYLDEEKAIHAAFSWLQQS